MLLGAVRNGAIFKHFLTAPYAVSRMALAMLFFYNGLAVALTAAIAEIVTNLSFSPTPINEKISIVSYLFF